MLLVPAKGDPGLGFRLGLGGEGPLVTGGVRFWRMTKMQDFELGPGLQLESVEMHFGHSRKDSSETLGRTSSSSF